MLFNSYEFLLAFLPLALLGYFGLAAPRGERAALAWLLGCSLLFYGAREPRHLLLLGLSLAVNYALGRVIVQRGPRPWFALGVVFDLGLLGWFKYRNFFLESGAQLLGLDAPGLPPLVLPLAISFFTFQQISFLRQCARGEVQEPDLLRYGVFVCFFPQLIAGPILHHRELMPQLLDPEARRPRRQHLGLGLTLLIVGLGKKVLLADRLALWSDSCFGGLETVGCLQAWLGALAFTLQLYFDFSGYVDIALGCALMLNVRLPLNFDSPLRSLDLQALWRRWHITLGRFLRNQVYLPLGGARSGILGDLRNLGVTFLLGGLWHGASWNFVLWGALHASGLALLRGWRRFGVRLPAALAWALTFGFFVLSLVPFRAATLQDTLRLWAAMFGAGLPSAARVVDQLHHLQGPAALGTDTWLTAALLLLGLGIVLWPHNSGTLPQRARSGWGPALVYGVILALSLVFLREGRAFVYFVF